MEELLSKYMTCIYATARAERERFHGERWCQDHMNALGNARDGFERGLLNTLVGLCHIAAAHEHAYAVPIGQDPVMGGQAWLVMARGLIASLTGSRGRFDAATFERSVRALARMAGFGEEV